MISSIASAVVLPEEETNDLLSSTTSPTSLKRRTTSFSEQQAKRTRVDGESNGSPVNAAPPKARERGRERRLFGAVLGALSHNPTSAAQKRRSEIEKRQLEQKRQDDEELGQRRLERIERRKAQRWREQKRLEAATMRARHRSLLSMAHFLQTETEPKLYYKPWETTQEEEQLIRKQIAEAREIIRRETAEHDTDHNEELRSNANPELGSTARGVLANTVLDDAETSGVPRTEAEYMDDTSPSSVTKKHNEPPEAHDNGGGDDHNLQRHSRDIEDTQQRTSDAPMDDTVRNRDDNGEEMVDAEEDTVIY